MKKNSGSKRSTAGVIFGDRRKPVLPTISQLLTVKQTETLKQAFADHGIGNPIDESRLVKTAVTSSGFFKKVKAVPGVPGLFEVILKNSPGKIAMGDFHFAMPTV